MTDVDNEAPLAIAEIFFSIQGEGVHVGKAAVFVRLAGCNLSCHFCDTDYAVREFLPIPAVLERVAELDPSGAAFVILTGGEPLAQRQTPRLIAALLDDGRQVHIESNGSVAVDLPAACWLTVSPKERLDPTMAHRADEVKLIVDRRVPLEWLDTAPWRNVPISLQPENNRPENIDLALAAIAKHPARLRLSAQLHKYLGVR